MNKQALTDPWFHVCLVSAAAETELVREFDRLNGTTLSGRATTIEKLVDEVSGKQKEDLEKFVSFVYKHVYLVVPRPE